MGSEVLHGRTMVHNYGTALVLVTEGRPAGNLRLRKYDEEGSGESPFHICSSEKNDSVYISVADL